MDEAVAERARAERAEQFAAVLVEQLRAAERRDAALQAQLRQLTALVEGLQRQLVDALGKLAAGAKRKKKKEEPEEPTDGGDDQARPEQPPGSGELAPPPSPDPPPERKPSDRPKQKPKRPARLPAHLRRLTERIPVNRCGKCGAEDLAEVGQGEVSERYHYVPAEIVVERIERPTCRCRECGAFTTAPMPPTAVPGGSMTAALYAHIAYSKCCQHLTLDRIADDLRRMGVDFAEATMCDAMGHIANLVDPLCDALVDEAFASGLLHLDGTGVKVLYPGEKGSYRGQFTVLSNDDVTAYFFSETKGGEHLTEFLRLGTKRAYKGYLVADAASNMDVLYADGTIIECGCWYHARDKFEEAYASAPREALEGIAWIGALFQVEHEADDADDAVEARKERRQRASRPVLDGFRAWMTATQARFDEDEDLWKAIQYCDNHWAALIRFLDHGRIPLTNNQAERDLGPIGRGRKTWLFAGSDKGGDRLAKIYTVIGTCLREQTDPRAYLTDVLPKLSTMPANRGRDIRALLPKAWKAARVAEAARAAEAAAGPDPPAPTTP